MKATYFSDFSNGRDNNFDFLRFFLAFLVIFSHAFGFLYHNGGFAREPIMRLTGMQFSLGGGAVKGFFLISGFLITRSWIYSKGFADYAIKRVLRIVPALIVVLLATVFIIGPIATVDRAGYFHNPATYRYLGFMLTPSLHKTDVLPGVFLHNPEANRVNGSLWTVRCEVLCYLMVALLGMAGVYRKRAIVLAAALVSVVIEIYMQIHVGADGAGLDGAFGPIQVTSYFLVGMAFYFYRDRIPYSLAALLTVVTVTVAAIVLNKLVFVLPFVYAYLLFYAAFNPNLRLQKFAKHGDLSYGLYLYAFPLQQMLVEFYKTSFNAYTLTLAGLVLTVLCAGLSWRFVEQPFLKMKPKSKTPTTLSTEKLDAAGLPYAPNEKNGKAPAGVG